MGRRVRSRPIRRLTIYHFELAIEAGCNAYAAPLGFLEAGARDFTGEIPLILKTNDNDVLREEEDPNQALTESARPAHVRHAQPSDGLAGKQCQSGGVGAQLHIGNAAATDMGRARDESLSRTC